MNNTTEDIELFFSLYRELPKKRVLGLLAEYRDIIGYDKHAQFFKKLKKKDVLALSIFCDYFMKVDEFYKFRNEMIYYLFQKG